MSERSYMYLFVIVHFVVVPDVLEFLYWCYVYMFRELNEKVLHLVVMYMYLVSVDSSL